MGWMLRLATLDDLDAIMAIESSVFLNDAWSRAGMRGELANPQTHYLVAFRAEEPAVVVGYAGLFAPLGAQEGDIQTIAVAPSVRRGGLGRLFMSTLIEETRKRGASELFLDVRADNLGAQDLYLSLGFSQIAVRPGYYQPDNVAAFVMRLPLTSVEGA